SALNSTYNFNMAYYNPPANNSLNPQTAYMLGLGPLPGPTSQQYATAQMQAALDSGMFDQTQRPGGHQIFEEDHEDHDDDDENIDPALRELSHTQASGTCFPNLTINVPLYGSKTNDKKIISANLVVPADIPPTDFFSRIHALMNADPAVAILGWKESTEHHRYPYHRLSSPQDLQDAFKTLVRLQSGRRRKPVVMEVVNLEVQPDGKTTKQPEKPSETELTVPELRKVQDKHTCTQHPGRNRWCYVMRPNSKFPGKHVPLDLELVSLWARKMYDGEVDEDCITPPNILNLDALAERGHPREERCARGRGQPAMLPIHIHVGGSGNALREVDTNADASRKRTREAYSDDSDSDDDSSLTIQDVLQDLNNMFPALNYPQYSEALTSKGIIYASSALDFDKTYYKETVGMADGAIGTFVKRVRKMVKGEKRNGRKRARESADSV
ncbi:hypothetical protein C8R44DRAFT_648573, partial [Mycena epipterygia]